MSILLDTNILTRAAQPGHAMHQLAVDSVAELRRQGETLCLVPQNLYEFWVVCTRPASQNGLGMSPTEAQAELSQLKALYTILDDTPAIFLQWEQLVVQYQVRGKNTHDAHLVAAMMVHGLNQVLTFNASDFRRYSALTILEPKQVLAAKPPNP